MVASSHRSHLIKVATEEGEGVAALVVAAAAGHAPQNGSGSSAGWFETQKSTAICTITALPQLGLTIMASALASSCGADSHLYIGRCALT